MFDKVILSLNPYVDQLSYHPTFLFRISPNVTLNYSYPWLLRNLFNLFSLLFIFFHIRPRLCDLVILPFQWIWVKYSRWKEFCHPSVFFSKASRIYAGLRFAGSLFVGNIWEYLRCTWNLFEWGYFVWVHYRQRTVWKRTAVVGNCTIYRFNWNKIHCCFTSETINL